MLPSTVLAENEPTDITAPRKWESAGEDGKAEAENCLTTVRPEPEKDHNQE